MTSPSRGTVGLTDVAILLEMLNASEEIEELYDTQLPEELQSSESALSAPESVEPHNEPEPAEIDVIEPDLTAREWIGGSAAQQSYKPLAAATDPNLLTPDDKENPFAAHIVRGMLKMKPG